MELTPTGRLVVGALALLVAGFGLGSLVGPSLPTEGSLAILTGAATLLVITARRGRDDDGA